MLITHKVRVVFALVIVFCVCLLAAVSFHDTSPNLMMSWENSRGSKVDCPQDLEVCEEKLSYEISKEEASANQTFERLLRLEGDNRLKQIFVVPERKLMFCVYPKAGITSFLNYIYKGLFHREFPEVLPGVRGFRSRYIYQPASPYWKGQLKELGDLSNEEKREVLFGKDFYRVAIYRDPFARLISSWRSKLTCDGAQDAYDSKSFTRNLLIRAGFYESWVAKGKNVECVGFSDFVSALASVKKRHLSVRMNNHFMNQDCLSHLIPYSQEFHLETISDGQLAKLRRLSGFSEFLEFGHSHGNNNQFVFNISLEEIKMLAWFTAP